MGFFNQSSWQSKEKQQPTIARCGLCGLAKGCYTPKMPPTGKGKRKILFITDAPGEDEDRQGEQLIDEAGLLLQDILWELDLDLNDCWKANAVLCRPPNDKIESKHIESCQPSVFNSIKELQPSVIIPLGEHAVQSVIKPIWKKDTGSISRWVGWAIPIHPNTLKGNEYGTWVCPTYHPKTLLKSKNDPLLRKLMKDHLKKAIGLEFSPTNCPTTEELQEQVEIIIKERHIKSKLRDLLKKEGLLAFDYETTGLKPEKEEQKIITCSFCFEGEETFAFPWSVEIERLVSKILQSPNLFKIASNMKFEERWTRRKLGHGVSPWEWDTMLAAHCIDNRPTITSIKFQAFVLLGIPDYSSHISSYLSAENANDFNRIIDVDLNDLLIYNGMDSLLEFKVSEIQKDIMKHGSSY